MNTIIDIKNANLTEYKFTIISDVSTKEASKSSNISLKNVIELIKTPNEMIVEARRYVDTDPEKYKSLKRRLPVLLPYELADKSDEGTFSNINRVWTQSFLMYFDVDHISKDDCDALKGELSLVEGVAFVFETTSGQGLRIATLVEGITESNYDGFYCKAMKYFNDYFGIVCDRACGNPGRKSFISYDPDPYVNYNCGFFNNTINAANISLEPTSFAKKKTSNNKNKSKIEGTTKLEYLHKAQQFKNAKTVLDATSFVLFVLKDLNFDTTDGSGRHTTLFYHVVLTGLRLGIPPQILEKGIWEGVSSYGTEAQKWLRGKYLKSMINKCYSDYCDDVVSINESSDGFKFEYTHTLEANTYLEERKEELTKILDESDKILLKAPTGAGKSTFISNYCIERLKQAFEESADCDSEGGGHVIIFQPNVFPTKRAYHELKGDTRIPKWIRDRIILVTGDNQISKAEISLHQPCLILAVIDQFDNVVKTLAERSSLEYKAKTDAELLTNLFNYVVIDEMHKIESDSSFRENMVNTTRLFAPGIKLTMITATPTFGCLKLCKEANYTTCEINTKVNKNVEIKRVMAFTFDTMLATMLDGLSQGYKVFARIGIKQDIKNLKKALEAKGKKVLAITADNKHNKEVKKFIETGLTDADAILSTKILEDGFSIMVPGKFCIVYNTNSAEIPDERAIKQFTARCRLATELDVYLFLNPVVAHIKGVREEKKQAINDIQNYIASISPVIRKDFGLQTTEAIDIKTICRIFENGVSKKDKINLPKILNTFSSASLCFDHYAGLFEKNLREIFDTEITQIGEPLNDAQKEEFREYKITRGEEIRDDLLEAAIKLSDSQIFSLCYRANKARMKIRGIRLSDERFSKMKIADALFELGELGLGEDFCDNANVKRLLSTYATIFNNTNSHAEKIKIIHFLISKRKLADFQERLTYVLHMEKKLAFNNVYKREDFKYDLSIYRAIEKHVLENKNVLRIDDYYEANKDLQNFKLVKINQAQDITKFFSRLFDFDVIRRKVKTEDGRTRQKRDYVNCVLKDPKDLLKEYTLSQDLIDELLDYEIDENRYAQIENECKTLVCLDFSKVDQKEVGDVKRQLDFKE